MSARARRKEVVEDEWVPQVSAMLGGRKVLGGALPRNRLEVHVALSRGLPNAAAVTLVEGLHLLHPAEVLKVIGFAERSWQRHRSEGKRPLSPERSSRAWKFAEVLARATKIFGSQEAAERWLDQPAIGLDHQRPVDLLNTQTGTELVEEFLERLDYGVYT